MKTSNIVKFLRRVWGETEGWAFIAYAGAGQFKHRAYNYPTQLNILANDVVELNTWADIWFCPHLFKTNTNRQKDNALPPRTLWVDFDNPEYERLQPPPTICWSTSNGRYQALWLLKEPALPDEVERLNRYITYSKGGDKGGWHINKVLRIPGSLNYKYQPPQEGSIMWDNGTVYDIAELTPAEPDPLKTAIKEITSQRAPSMPKALPEYIDVLKEFGQKIPKAAWELINADSSAKEDWSEELWKLERLLFEARLPEPAVFVIVKNSPWNKYARDNRPDKHLWEEVYKASLEKGPFQASPEELPWVGMGELLVYSERPEWMVQDFWMDKNVGWIAGVGKSYKTVISLDLALSVASGRPFLNKYRVLKPGPVLMVQEEDPIWRVAHRMQVMSQKKGISQVSVKNTDYSLILELKQEKTPLYVSVGGGFLFKDREKTVALERAIDRYRPKLIVLDPMFMLAAGLDENRAGEMAATLNLMKRWRNDYGCAIAVVHHYTKATSGNGNGGRERLYGSMALYAWSENSMFVSRASGNSVVIERDIKDALITSRVAIDFIDIEEDYHFMLQEADERDIADTHAPQKIIAYLLSLTPGVVVSRQTVSDTLDISTKTVSKILQDFSEAGLIVIDRTGKHRQMRISPTAKLWELKRGMDFS